MDNKHAIQKPNNAPNNNITNIYNQITQHNNKRNITSQSLTVAGGEGDGEGEGDCGGGQARVVKPVLVTDMKHPRGCKRVESAQIGLSGPREETASSRRCCSLDLFGQ